MKMDNIHSDVILVLLDLLPGLATIAIIQALTVRERIPPLERMIQALIYTYLDHVSVSVIFLVLQWLLSLFSVAWTPSTDVRIVVLVGCAVGWGIVLSILINKDWLYQKLRSLGVTKRSSRPTEWYDAFYRWAEYVVVHLTDQRRVYGWPRLYPDSADKGHLVLEDAEWLDAEAGSGQHVRMVIPVNKVEFVEFVPMVAPMENEDESQA